jgi:hypothetical protein
MFIESFSMLTNRAKIPKKPNQNINFYLIMKINFEISSHNFGFRSIKFLIKLKLMFWLGFLGILALLVNILKDSINIIYFYTSLSHYLQIRPIIVSLLTITMLYVSIIAIGLNFAWNGTSLVLTEYNSYFSFLAHILLFYYFFLVYQYIPFLNYPLVFYTEIILLPMY